MINKQEVPATKFSINHCSFHVSKHTQTTLAVWWRELWALLACFVQLLSSLPLLKEISKDIWKNTCRFQGLQSQLSWKDAEAWLRPLLAHLSYFAVPSKSCFQEGYQYFPEGTGMSTTMKNTVTSMQLASTMLPPKF